MIFLFSSPLTRIKKITITGDKVLHQKVFTIAKFQSPYIFSRNAPLQAALLAIPQIKDATIQKDIFEQTISITYMLRTPLLAWCSGDKQHYEGGKSTPICYMVDDTGVLFNSSFLPKDTIALFDSYFPNVTIGEKIPEAYFSFIKKGIETFQHKGIALAYLSLKKPFLLEATPKNLPALRFSLQEPLIDQTRTLFLFLDHADKEKLMILHYIDLRIPNKVYYK